jgi:hypothetical protein
VRHLLDALGDAKAVAAFELERSEDQQVRATCVFFVFFASFVSLRG